MRSAVLFAILMILNGSLLAQSNRPSMTWQGEVTGGATLYIQGNRVDVQGRTTGAVDRPTYRFRETLPAVVQTVKLRVVRGGNGVNIAEHPNESNEFAAIVDIRNDGRPQMYSLEFYWKPETKDSKQQPQRP